MLVPAQAACDLAAMGTAVHRAGDSPALARGHIRLLCSTQLCSALASLWVAVLPTCYSAAVTEELGKPGAASNQGATTGPLKCHKGSAEHRTGILMGTGTTQRPGAPRLPDSNETQAHQFLQLQSELGVSSGFSATTDGLGLESVPIKYTYHPPTLVLPGAAPLLPADRTGPSSLPRALPGLPCTRVLHTGTRLSPAPLPPGCPGSLRTAATLTPCGEEKALRDSTGGTESGARHRTLPTPSLSPTTASTKSRHSSNPCRNLHSFGMGPCPRNPVLTGGSLSHRHRALRHRCCDRRRVGISPQLAGSRRNREGCPEITTGRPPASLGHRTRYFAGRSSQPHYRSALPGTGPHAPAPPAELLPPTYSRQEGSPQSTQPTCGAPGR